MHGLRSKRIAKLLHVNNVATFIGLASQKTLRNTMFPIRFSNSRLCNLLNYESVILKNEKIFFLITYLIKKRRFPIDE